MPPWRPWLCIGSISLGDRCGGMTRNFWRFVRIKHHHCCSSIISKQHTKDYWTPLPSNQTNEFENQECSIPGSHILQQPSWKITISGVPGSCHCRTGSLCCSNGPSPPCKTRPNSSWWLGLRQRTTATDHGDHDVYRVYHLESPAMWIKEAHKPPI